MLQPTLDSRYFLVEEAYVYGVKSKKGMDCGLPESTFQI